MKKIEEPELTINLKKALNLLGITSERTIRYHKKFYKIEDLSKQYPISYFIGMVGFDFVTDSLTPITEASKILGVSVSVLKRVSYSNKISIYTNNLNRHHYILDKDISFIQRNIYTTYNNNFIVRLSQELIELAKIEWFKVGDPEDTQTKVVDMLLKKNDIPEIADALNISVARVNQVSNKLIRVFSNQMRKYDFKTLIYKIRDLESENNQLKKEVQALREFKNVKGDLPISQKELMLTSIKDLELSVRTYNCLKSAGVNTVWQLAELKISDLMRFRNFGKKSLNELTDYLTENGLEFGMDVRDFI